MNFLIRPVVTEKSMQNVSHNRYTFAVAISANKAQIASEVKKTFGVTVLSVKTITVKGKTKRAGKRRIETKTTPWKKAIIEIAKGQKIDLFDTTENAEKS